MKVEGIKINSSNVFMADFYPGPGVYHITDENDSNQQGLTLIFGGCCYSTGLVYGAGDVLSGASEEPESKAVGPDSSVTMTDVYRVVAMMKKPSLAEKYAEERR